MSARPRIVIEYRGWARRAADAWRSLVPYWLKRVVVGPVQRVSMDEQTGSGGGRGWRPVDLILPDGAVLSRRVKLAKAGRREIVHAIALFISHETPFELHEVAVQGSELPHGPGDEMIAFDVRVLPLAPVTAALRAMRIPAGRVRRIVAPGPDHDVDMAGAFFPRRRFRRWIVIVPVLIALIALGLGASADLARRQTAAARLQTEVDALLQDLRTLSAEMEAHNAATAGTDALLAMIGKSPSAYTRLEQVRQLLPASTEITRIEIRNDELRLSVRSDNALADAQTLGTSDIWTSTVESAITTDPSGQREVAVILLRGGPKR